LLFAFLGVLQVTLFSPPARKGRGEEVVADPPVCLDFPAAARESRRRQWRWRVEKTRRHCSGDPKDSQRCSGGLGLPALVPRLSFVIFRRGCVFSDYLYLIFEFLLFFNL
jgi:hypothetical protein